MNIVLSSIVRGHMFYLAKYLYEKNNLAKLFTSYPHWKLTDNGIPKHYIETTPWFLVPYMALYQLGVLRGKYEQRFSWISSTNHEAYVRRNILDCDIFHGLSGHNLAAGLKAKSFGAKYICDRGSSHINYQNSILREEAELLGLPYLEINLRVIAKEIEEYKECDRIFVASKFAKKTFVENGVDNQKISVIPYGVDLKQFKPMSVENDRVFRVVYFGALSIRKGIHYLAKAFAMIDLPRSELVLIGQSCPETEMLLASVKGMNVIRTGIISRDEVLKWLSRSSVMVLPSIEDGFGLVLLEAQACGLPVIATENTGGPDCIENGINGFIVPIRSSESIAEKLIFFYENADYRINMGKAGLDLVKLAGGWSDYGDNVLKEYQSILT